MIKFFLGIFGFFGNLIPKSSNVWIFGSWDGWIIKDNSKDLFDYIKENKDLGINGIFITKNKSLVNSEQNILYAYSLKGIYYQLIGEKYFMTTSYTDLSIFSFLSPQKSTYIQLWHGTPLKKLKKIGWSWLKIKIHSYFMIYLGRQYDFVVTTGRKSTELMKYYFNPEMVFLELGFPRNDKLLKNSVQKNIISIIPTFRPYNYSLIKQIDFENLSLIGVRYGYKIIIKIHPKEIELYGRPDINGYDNITIDTKTDTYDLINQTAILVTDYSSIFIDFLLKDRPIIFAGFDLEEYQDNVGLLMEYSDMPGYLTKNSSELEDSLIKILDGNDSFVDIRHKQSREYYSDMTFSCPRIVSYFKS